MKLKQRTKPFILYLPGFNGDIGSVFTVNKLYWEPFVIFNHLPSEIQSVSVNHPSDTVSSFRITAVKGKFFMNGETSSDSLLVNRYISYFTFIPFDEWAVTMTAEETRKIEMELPLYIIKLDLVNGERKTLTLWAKNDVRGDTIRVDSNRLFGKLHDRDQLFIVRYFDVDPILKRKSYFTRH
jgi:hypothetical protein